MKIPSSRDPVIPPTFKAFVNLQEAIMAPYTSTDVVIPLSKGKVILLGLCSLVFVAGSLWIWGIADGQTSLYMKVVAMAGASFFGMCAIYCLLKVFDTRPGLVLDDQGILDNSSAVAAGRMLWDEVLELKVTDVGGQRFLTIVVSDPQKYASRGNFLKRMLNAANASMTGSPINISSHSLAMSFDELVQVMTSAFEAYKRTQQVSW